MSLVKVTLPLRLESVANGSHGHWAARAKKTKAQRTGARLACEAQHPLAVWQGEPLVVLLTRVAPRSLDAEDNLPRAFKAIRDGVADALRVRDNDPRLTWRYRQERGLPKHYEVRVEVVARTVLEQLALEMAEETRRSA